MFEEIIKIIENHGIIPVIKIEDDANAVPLGKALCKGGLHIAEVTFRTDAAAGAIQKLTRNIPELTVGAGTVLNVDQVKTAVGSGAKFIVSPGFNPKVVGYCLDQKIPVFPGINSPSQIEAGIEYGLKLLKFFPAEESGGIAFLKAVSAPYDGIKFIPTGGVNPSNLVNYLALKNVSACGGSWMVKPDIISAGKFDEITRLTKEAVQTMLGFEFAHLGINDENEKKAEENAAFFADHFFFRLNPGQSSIFLGQNAKEIEIMKTPYLGKRGHIAIAVNNIHRALFYLSGQDIKELPETRKEKDGKLRAVYLDKEIAGFALHLLQK